MFIIDYSSDYYGNKIETITFHSDSTIIDFAAEQSEKENFKIHRINKYENGKLCPHELTLKNGRIAVEELPKEAK